MGFQGKTAVVTGGAQGIGLAVVKAFKKHGARVAVIDLQEGGSMRLFPQRGHRRPRRAGAVQRRLHQAV